MKKIKATRLLDIFVGIGFIIFGYHCLTLQSFVYGTIGFIVTITGVLLIIGVVNIEFD